MLEGQPLTALTQSPKLKPMVNEKVGDDILDTYERAN
jgi:hypothetical protein